MNTQTTHLQASVNAHVLSHYFLGCRAPPCRAAGGNVDSELQRGTAGRCRQQFRSRRRMGGNYPSLLPRLSLPQTVGCCRWRAAPLAQPPGPHPQPWALLTLSSCAWPFSCAGGFRAISLRQAREWRRHPHAVPHLLVQWRTTDVPLNGWLQRAAGMLRHGQLQIEAGSMQGWSSPCQLASASSRQDLPSITHPSRLTSTRLSCRICRTLTRLWL